MKKLYGVLYLLLVFGLAFGLQTCVYIDPIPAYTNDVLECHVDESCTERDIIPSNFEWYINDVYNTSGNTLAGGNFSRDDEIRCEYNDTECLNDCLNECEDEREDDEVYDRCIQKCIAYRGCVSDFGEIIISNSPPEVKWLSPNVYSIFSKTMQIQYNLTDADYYEECSWGMYGCVDNYVHHWVERSIDNDTWEVALGAVLMSQYGYNYANVPLLVNPETHGARFFRVCANDTETTRVCSQPTDTWSTLFNSLNDGNVFYGDNMVDKPTNILPASGAILGNSIVNFSWSPVPEAIYYILHIQNSTNQQEYLNYGVYLSGTQWDDYTRTFCWGEDCSFSDDNEQAYAGQNSIFGFAMKCPSENRNTVLQLNISSIMWESTDAAVGVGLTAEPMIFMGDEIPDYIIDDYSDISDCMAGEGSEPVDYIYPTLALIYLPDESACQAVEIGPPPYEPQYDGVLETTKPYIMDVLWEMECSNPSFLKILKVGEEYWFYPGTEEPKYKANVSFAVESKTRPVAFVMDVAQANLSFFSYVTPDETRPITLYEGEYCWNAKAFDKALNMNESDLTCFTIDLTPPKIQLVSPENGSTVTPGTQIVFNITDNNPDQEGYIIGEQNYNFSEDFIIPTDGWADGCYYITVWANDMVGLLSEEVYKICLSTPSGGGDDEPSDPILPDYCGAQGICDPSCPNDPDCPVQEVEKVILNETKEEQAPPEEKGESTPETVIPSAILIVNPDEGEIGTMLNILLRTDKGEPLQNVTIRVSKPDGKSEDLETNKNGRAFYFADLVGLYNFKALQVEANEENYTSKAKQYTGSVSEVVGKEVEEEKGPVQPTGMFLAGQSSILLALLLIIVISILYYLWVNKEGKQGKKK